MAFNISNLLVNNKSNKTPLIVVFIIITFFTVFTSWYLLSGDDDDKNNKSNKNDDGDDNTTPESESKQDNTDLTNTCDASVAPTNGGVGDCTSTLASGKTCTPTCDVGYTLWSPDGSNLTSCHLGNLTAASCLANSCDASVAPMNGGVGDCTSTLASGSTCTPTCDDGYTLSGQTSCSLGILTSSATCEPKSCTPKPQPVSDNATTRKMSQPGTCKHELNSLASGESCIQNCPSGYTMPGKSTCLNGEMTYSICTPSSCTIDPTDSGTARVGVDYTNCGTELAHGGTELAHGGTCTPKCLDGYTLSDTYKTVSCSYGQLTIDTQCISNSCDLPNAPDNGKLGTCADITTTKMNSGDTCDFECNQGYTLTGEKTKCYLGTLTEQTCEPKSCPIVNPTNGGAGDCPTDELAHNGTCTPTCDTGYTLSTTKSTTSCSYGVLTKAECLPDSCDASVAPRDGDVGNCTSELASGSECTPTCKKGYTLSGKTSCSAGTLSPASCEPSTCDASTATKNSVINDKCTTELAHGSECEPTCKDGYTRAGETKCYLGDLLKVATCFLYQYEFILNHKTSVVHGPFIEYIEIDGELLKYDQTFLHKKPNHHLWPDSSKEPMFSKNGGSSKWSDVSDKIFTIGSDTKIEKIKIVYSQPQYVPGWIIKENGIEVIKDTGNGGELQTPSPVTYTYDITNGTSKTDTPPLRFNKHEKTKFKEGVTNIWIDAGLSTTYSGDRSDKTNTVTSEQHLAKMDESNYDTITDCKTKCADMDKCKSILYYPGSMHCYFSGVRAKDANIEENLSDNSISKTDIYEIVRPKGKSCDVTPPDNGGLGTCTSVLEDDETCTYTCNPGYTRSGDTSCDDGTLTQETCYKKATEYGYKCCTFGTTNVGEEYRVDSTDGQIGTGKNYFIKDGTMDDCKNACDKWENCAGFSRVSNSSKSTQGCVLSSWDWESVPPTGYYSYYYKKN